MRFVGDRLDRFAAELPERAALTCGPKRLSRRELVRAVGRLERDLMPLTVAGGRIVLRLRDPVALLLSFFACARTRRTAVVLDPDWPEALTGPVLAEVGPDLVIDDKLFSDFRAAGAQITDTGRQSAPTEADLFYAGFTSGSSGKPKGYLRSHGSWLDSFALSEDVFGIAKDSRIIVPGQLTHSLHLYGAVCGLACGHEVVLTPRFDPRSVLAELSAADRMSALYATPTQLHFIAEAAKRSGPVETVRHVLASGSKWQDRDRKRLVTIFPNAKLIEFYGASEMSFITISGAGEMVPPGSVGRPPKGVEIAIGDPAEQLPDGCPGVIWVKSKLLFSGYVCGYDPETRWQDGWLTVGDVGYLDQNGYLFLVGRTGRMIVTSGLNVYPEEIEAVLLSHPSVAAAVVVGLDDPVRGQRLEAVVEMSAPLPDLKAALLSHCRKHLAPGKRPRRFHLYERLPTTPGGKPDIQRIALELQNKEAAE